MSLSVVAPVTVSVHTGLTLGFKKPSVNIDGAGVGAGVMKWKDAFGGMKNGMSSSSFLLSITNEGNGSIANVAPSSSMPLLPMAQVVFTGTTFCHREKMP
ncbi:hypothetical protein P3S67_017632 [Capsicum chacoense]